MKNNFKGWFTVFGFTLRQSMKGASFKIVTTLIALCIIGVFLLINIVSATPANEQEKSPVKTIFVLDQSGLQPIDYPTLNPELSEDQFKDIEFVSVTAQSRDEVIKTAAEDSEQSIAVIITSVTDGYTLEAVIPVGSSVAKAQANRILAPMKSAFETGKMMQSGLSIEQLSTALQPIVTSYSDIGENTNDIVYVIKTMAPMLFGLIMYLMLLLYGQNISNSISTEKTSKLMETLLTSIHPYALISGKVLAVTTMAVLQFVIWIASIIVGLYGGNAAAHLIYPEYENSVITIISFLKDNIGDTAMSVPAVVLAILTFSVGFLFYSNLAGLAGSMVSKPEDASHTQSIFVFPVLISWLICYMAPFMGNETLITVSRYVPFTIPFCMPADLITGSIGLVQGVISLAILTVFCLLIIMLSGKLYKGLILYTGQKASFKTLVNVLRAKG